MKIINRENDQEVVYVQKSDMMYVTHNCTSFPAALMDDFFSDIVIINGDNRDEFVRFTDPSEVEFFKKQDWIIDYLSFKDLTEEEIIGKCKSIIGELNAVIDEFNATNNEDKKQELYQKHELLDYKFNSAREFLWFKQGHVKYSFPVVPDSEGFSFSGDSTYEIKAGLEPNQILLYRLDGERLRRDEQIPVSFVQMGMSIALMETAKNNPLVGDYQTSNSLSEDEKYFIISFEFKPYEETLQEEQTEEVSVLEPVKKETYIKRLVKRIFNRK